MTRKEMLELKKIIYNCILTGNFDKRSSGKLFLNVSIRGRKPKGTDKEIRKIWKL